MLQKCLSIPMERDKERAGMGLSTGRRENLGTKLNNQVSHYFNNRATFLLSRGLLVLINTDRLPGYERPILNFSVLN